MRVIEREEVYKNLSMEVCIQLMKEALAQLDEGTAKQIVRTGMGTPKGGLAFMPCYMGKTGNFGAKILSVFPGNGAQGYPSHQGYVMLFEGEHGRPVAMADAAAITEVRTAAASAAATDLLARRDSHRLAIVGSGAQARSHLEAMCQVRDIKEVTVWSYHRENAWKFVKEMEKNYSQRFRVCETVEEAVREADIVCTVSRTREPIVKASYIRPGTHINAVGTCSPVSREVDSDLVAASRLYVDQVEACMAESGEYLIPLKEGKITESHIVGSIGGVVNRKVPARQNEEEITLFDSLGLAVEDLICAEYLYRKCENGEELGEGILE